MDDYDNEGHDPSGQRRERKKKKHRKPREDNYNEEDTQNDYGRPNANEDENDEIAEAQPRRKHRSKQKKRNEDYEDDEVNNAGYNNRSNPGRYNEPEQSLSPEPEYGVVVGGNRGHKGYKGDKRKKSYPEDASDSQYLNINTRLPNYGNGNNQHYNPEENEDEEEVQSLQLDEELDSQHDNESVLTDGNNEHQPENNEDQLKPKKKSGFMKIFSSFKKKNKGKQADGKVNGNQWQSNPEIFNPAYDNQTGTLEKSSKKPFSKSARDLAFSKAKVIFLDQLESEYDVTSKMTGKELFEILCEYLDLEERDFFGLTYNSKKMQTWFWLDMEKRISKQLANDDDWIFNFQVKFYPPEPVLLQQDVTRYLLCLQVRQDVFTSKLPCSWITQALLGSFMVQSELGDFDELEHGEGIDYLREFEFVRNQSDELLEKINELHKKHIGMPPDRADIKYLETAKRLEQYGVDLHPARDNDDVEISIGVCYQGVLIYRERTRIGRFAWPKVLRISYKKNYFYLKIRSDRYDDSVAIVGFKLFNHNLAKRLWKNAVEQHTFFRMKESQNQKKNQKIILSGASNYGYTGMTLHQYRSMNISRNKPVKFERSVAKRRTIGSMPAGLEKAGMQYSSMHSLNRMHPRDMQLGTAKSTDHLNVKRPGSNFGTNQYREGSVSNISSRQQPQNKYPAYASAILYRDDDRHLSFQSGDSLNAADSYTARNDDQMSLPPMPHLSQPEYARPYKKNTSKTTRPSDVLSDDGINSKPMKKQLFKSRPNDDLSDEEINPQPIYSKPFKKQNSKTARQNDASLNINVESPELPKPSNRQYPKASQQNDILSNDGINSPPENPKIKRHSSKTPHLNDVLSDDGFNSPPGYSKTSGINNVKMSYPNDELSDDNTKTKPEQSKPVKKHSSRNRPSIDPNTNYDINVQPEITKPVKKKSSKVTRSEEYLSDEDVVSPVPPSKGKVDLKVGGNLNLPDPPIDTSQSEDLDSFPRVKKRTQNKSPASSTVQNQNRPQPPNHFRTPPPPPPPPEMIPQVRSNTSSERSSPMEHQLPPPPPPIIEFSQVSKPKPPPVKPKPALKPKPNIGVKGQLNIKANARLNDEDML